MLISPVLFDLPWLWYFNISLVILKYTEGPLKVHSIYLSIYLSIFHPLDPRIINIGWCCSKSREESKGELGSSPMFYLLYIIFSISDKRLLLLLYSPVQPPPPPLILLEPPTYPHNPSLLVTTIYLTPMIPSSIAPTDIDQ